jgi:cell division transport system permease protein
MKSLKISKLSVVISISLVLLLAGVFATLMIYTNTLAKNIKENLAITLVLKEGSGYAQMISIEEQIKNEKIVKKVNFISAEKAAEQLKQQLGEDFISVIGYNPLLPMAEVFIYSDFADISTINKLVAKLKSNPLVKEIKVQDNLLDGLEKMNSKISLAFITLIVLLLIIVFSLIHQSIRLSIYSQRFTIKTLQLVGSTSKYIRKPFLINSTINGFLGGIVSVLLLSILIFIARENIAGIKSLDSFYSWMILSFALILSGIFISLMSTLIVVSNFLKYDIDQLYSK